VQCNKIFSPQMPKRSAIVRLWYFKIFIYGLKDRYRKHLVPDGSWNLCVTGRITEPGVYSPPLCIKTGMAGVFSKFSLTATQSPLPLQRRKHSPQHASFLFPSTDTNVHFTRVCINDTGRLSASRRLSLH
jgi:hypothetical protein